MNTKTLGWIVVLGATVCSFASCSQPKADCVVLLAGAGYSYATKYNVVGTPSAECVALVQQGDLIGMETYHPVSADMLTYDSSKTSLALQADSLGNEILARGGDTAHVPWSQGEFTSATPDSSDFCAVPTLKAPGEQDFPDVGAVAGTGGAGGGAMAPMPEVPADNVKYEWSNIKIYVTAAAQGTQFTADLKYSEKVTTIDPMTMAATVVADCTINYKVVGMGPGIACTKLDDMGAPVLDAMGNQQADETLCSPCTDPAAGRTIASGINPNFPTSCQHLLSDADPYGRPAFYCVLKDTSASATLPQLGDAPTCPADANLN
jgi:hypothetical protein